VSKNPEHHGKMKHLSLRLFWLRDAVEDKVILPQFVETQKMAADIFTKALDRFKVQRCARMLGLE
jgi:ABC-type iron transport system FetAB ATPase subunit